VSIMISSIWLTLYVFRFVLASNYVTLACPERIQVFAEIVVCQFAEIGGSVWAYPVQLSDSGQLLSRTRRQRSKWQSFVGSSDPSS